MAVGHHWGVATKNGKGKSSIASGRLFPEMYERVSATVKGCRETLPRVLLVVSCYSHRSKMISKWIRYTEKDDLKPSSRDCAMVRES